MSAKQSLTTTEVRHIAKLANLKLTESELDNLSKQLTAIIVLVSKLQEVDTTKIQPTSQVTGLENVFREDKVRPSLTQEEALSNAPRKHNGYFVVNAIFE